MESKLPHFIIYRNKMTKANKNPPVPFNCTFKVIAMHSISFVLNIQVISHCFLPVSKCTPFTGAGTKARKHTDTRIPDSHIKNCFKICCVFSSNYAVAYWEGQLVMRKNSLVSCILIISTKFNSEVHLLQRVLANSPEYNPKALLICKEVKKPPHIDNIFFPPIKCWEAQA